MVSWVAALPPRLSTPADCIGTENVATDEPKIPLRQESGTPTPTPLVDRKRVFVKEGVAPPEELDAVE